MKFVHTPEEYRLPILYSDLEKAEERLRAHADQAGLTNHGRVNVLIGDISYGSIRFERPVPYGSQRQRLAEKYNSVAFIGSQLTIPNIGQVVVTQTHDEIATATAEEDGGINLHDQAAYGAKVKEHSNAFIKELENEAREALDRLIAEMPGAAGGPQ